MQFVDWGFILYAVYVPLLIALYLIELIIIFRNRNQFYSSFYLICSVIAIVDVLACLIGSFLFRLPLFPIVDGFYGSLLGKREWISALHTLGYYLNCLSQIVGVLLAINRFTGLFLPQHHDKIWLRLLFLCITICLLVSVLPVWFLFGYPIEFKVDTNDTEFPFYFLEVDWIPQKAIWWNMAVVTVVCNSISFLIYVVCLIRLWFFSIWRNSTAERNFLLVGVTSMLFSIPYMLVMLYLHLIAQGKVPYTLDAMLFLIFQLPLLTDLKYLSPAPILLLTNSSIRTHIRTMFCGRNATKINWISKTVPNETENNSNERERDHQHILRMLSVLITGANRGIGLGLVQQFLQEPTVSIVIATARCVETAKELTSIDNAKLHVIACDVSDKESIAAAVGKVSEIVSGRGLDILINNAGMGYLMPLNGDVSKAQIIEQLEVNTVAPLLLANKFYHLLKNAASTKGVAQIVNISSSMGSLEKATSHTKQMPLTVYAMTKSALNMLTRRIAVEWKDYNIRATSFCPGWVKTDMGTQDADLTVEESTKPLTRLILSLNEEHNGNFYKFNGDAIPW